MSKPAARTFLFLLLLAPGQVLAWGDHGPWAHAAAAFSPNRKAAVGASMGNMSENPGYGHLRKVVAGGQTGVDQAGLRAARKAGLETGGWCPPECRSLDGPVPLEFGLKPTPEEKSAKAPDVPRSLRTEWNVRDSDATLIFSLGVSGCTSDPDLSLFKDDRGTAFTIVCARRYTPRPLLVCDPKNARTRLQITLWIRSHSIEILNVAGPAEKTSPGIGKQAENLFLQVFASLRSK